MMAPTPAFMRLQSEIDFAEASTQRVRNKISPFSSRLTRYGPPDVLQIRDVEKPVPNDDEVLMKVRAAFREQSLPG
jgi:hypothetical protein